MTIAEKIYLLRSKHGLSQKEFAERVDASQSAVNYWENGKRAPKLVQLQKIASAFSITLDSLLSTEPVFLTNSPFNAVFDSYVDEQENFADIHFATDEYTMEELEEIYHFAEFIKSRRIASDKN